MTKHFLQAIENDQPMAINLREALHLVRKTPNKIRIHKIQNCWKHTGIVSTASPADIVLAACGTETEVVEEIQKDMLGLQFPVNISHLLATD